MGFSSKQNSVAPFEEGNETSRELARPKKISRKQKQKLKKNLYSQTNNAPNEKSNKNSDEPTGTTLEKTPSNASALHLIKKGTTLQVIRGFIADYSNATSIHGIKYFGARKKRWYERIFWFSLVCASMYYCVVLTLTTWNNWYNNPVIVSLAESTTPIWEIPFPAVTICPLIKYRRDEFSYAELLDMYKNKEMRKNMTNEELQKFEAISQVCITNLLFFKNFQFLNQTSVPPENETLPEFLKDMAPHISETLENVKWRKNDLINFEHEIQDVLTDDGVCFSFNTLDDSRIYRHHTENPNILLRNMTWSLEDGYKKSEGTKAYPRRVLAGDVDEGFYVTLKSNMKDTDPNCGGKSQGFKIILHTPGEFPLVTKRFFRVPYSQIVSVAVKPNMITTSPVVRSYDPEKRQCFFNNERYLRYFKIYTQANCEHECLTNATIQSCNCVKFSMPKEESIEYCGASNIKCYREVRKELVKTDGFKKICHCLPACTSIAYDAEITQSIFKPDKESDGNDNYTSTVNDRMSTSIMNVYFAKNRFLSAKRSELYGIADLIANIGGLFGLFMGVSILSIVEIIYFCTLRLHVNMQMRKKNKKKDEPASDSKDKNNLP